MATVLCTFGGDPGHHGFESWSGHIEFLVIYTVLVLIFFINIVTNDGILALMCNKAVPKVLIFVYFNILYLYYNFTSIIHFHYGILNENVTNITRLNTTGTNKANLVSILLLDRLKYCTAVVDKQPLIFLVTVDIFL